ncbi:MAG: hypothetical protein IPP29_18465 [Bacteroidetes bacterium]|nr:hypothetical protein [Bacteroidota bacterium]
MTKPSNAQLYRWSLLLFGHDHETNGTPLHTNIVPEFLGYNGDFPCVANDKSKIGDLMLGHCNWSNIIGGNAWPIGSGTAVGVPHYLHQVEGEFFKQYNDYLNVCYSTTDPKHQGNTPYTDWGNLSLLGGFYYHQYGNGDANLTVLDLPTRNGDRVQYSPNSCNSLRQGTPTVYNACWFKNKRRL